MYWRVAVIDPDGNVGAFSKAKKFTTPRAHGGDALAARRRRASAAVVTITVVDAKGKPVKGLASSCAAPASKTGAHKTNKKGIVTFSIKPTKAANLVVTANKKLYKVATASIAVS